MTRKRSYICRACGTPGCRVDRCGKATKEFLVDRVEWIRRVQRELRSLGARPLSFLELDHQWRRKHGYCTNCPRRTSRWFCIVCSKIRSRLPSRETAYRREREWAPASRKDQP